MEMDKPNFEALASLVVFQAFKLVGSQVSCMPKPDDRMMAVRCLLHAITDLCVTDYTGAKGWIIEAQHHISRHLEKV